MFTFNNRFFVKPLLSDNDLTLDKERELIGILKYGNSSLEALKITPGDVVGYTPGGEYEFFIDGERLYCMKSNDIVSQPTHKIFPNLVQIFHQNFLFCLFVFDTYVHHFYFKYDP